MSERIHIYDTTLRDGSQAEGISFSVEDKLKILRCLDGFGIDYVEGGWPGSNPKDIAFFRAAREVPLRRTKLSGFGSTCRPGLPAEDDANLKALLEVETPAVAIFGKSWTLHVREIFRTSLEENLRMIRDSIRMLKAAGREVIYDAEHFYDGYEADAGYALETLRAASEGGADCLVLCDTNGGTLPHRFAEITGTVISAMGGSIGVHVHNDSGVAVANTIEGVRLGANHVQGTFNGLGERCGNADLTAVIPNLILKMDLSLGMGPKDLVNLTHVARYVSAIANHRFPENNPYVGAMAFAHKGGVHVNSVMKRTESYEHVRPEDVGNNRRVLVSELSGRSNILYLAREEGIDIDARPEASRDAVGVIKRLENEGYQFEGAEGSAALIIRRALGEVPVFFELVGFRVIVERRAVDRVPISEATIKIRVGGKERLSVGEGSGPVHALDAALRGALREFYPEVQGIRLTDYKVRVIDETAGTSARVRVLIDSADSERRWGTVGVSENIIEASWQALIDSIVYGLARRGTEGKARRAAVESACEGPGG